MRGIMMRSRAGAVLAVVSASVLVLTLAGIKIAISWSSGRDSDE